MHGNVKQQCLEREWRKGVEMGGVTHSGYKL